MAGSVEELLAGARRLGAHRPDDARSSAGFERVEVDGEPCLVKYVHPEQDFTMRVSGDIGCRPRRVWQAGLMDAAPELIDHATLGAAPWGANGWGVALLMRDVSADLIPVGGEPVTEEQHLAFLDAIAGLSARFWGWEDDLELLPHRLRWSFFGRDQLDGEAALGWPEAVPKLAAEGWARFDRRAPADVVDVVEALRRDPQPLSIAIRTTPQTFLHGDWKYGNLGYGTDGRVILLDWAYPGQGPVAHELAWYLALNRARLPAGHTKETTIADLRSALQRHGVDTHGWWDRQLVLCLLGAVVQFGWEKAYGDDEELGWWIDAARDGQRLAVSEASARRPPTPRPAAPGRPVLVASTTAWPRCWWGTALVGCSGGVCWTSARARAPPAGLPSTPGRRRWWRSTWRPGCWRTTGPSGRLPCWRTCRALPFADGSFGAVVAAFSLNHLRDPVRGLVEASPRGGAGRRPGGLGVLDGRLPSGQGRGRGGLRGAGLAAGPLVRGRSGRRHAPAVEPGASGSSGVVRRPARRRGGASAGPVPLARLCRARRLASRHGAGGAVRGQPHRRRAAGLERDARHRLGPRPPVLVRSFVVIMWRQIG